jgi:hypothetical protein
MRIGPGSAIYNNDFEKWSGNAFPGWDRVASYQGVAWNGRFYRDELEKHSGSASLRLENVTDADIVQVSQNVEIGGGIVAGKKHRLSAWMKTDHLARSGAINLGAFTVEKKWVGLGSVPAPPASAGWSRSSTEFTMPESATMLRVMIHIVGKAKVWVDDLSLEELRPDGTAVPALTPDTPPGHKLMKQWVELFHGKGRPYLLFGRMLHPPKLECATTVYEGMRPLGQPGQRPAAPHRPGWPPAILHNAFRAPDGSEAVIVVNPTSQKQSAKMYWRNKEVTLELEPEQVMLVTERQFSRAKTQSSTQRLPPKKEGRNAHQG